MPLFYGTFGPDHLDGTGANKYVDIEANNRQQAHQIMFQHFGPRFSYVYTSATFAADLAEFHLIRANPYPDPFTAEDFE